jgi:hypothetical protein
LVHEWGARQYLRGADARTRPTIDLPARIESEAPLLCPPPFFIAKKERCG